MHIMTAGTHTASDGTRVEFSDAVLADIATSYDPALHEAPLVIGHPKGSAHPAYGWVKAITHAGRDLNAEPHQVDPDFQELVTAGRFKKRSLSVYAPDSPDNPKPGHWYLRHVGFLGATPPAVKGLRDYAFREGERGVVELMERPDANLLATIFRSLREAWIEKFGVDSADRTLPDWHIQDLEAQARPPQNAEATPITSFAEPPSPGDHTMTPEQQAALDAREKAIKEQEDSIKAKADEIARKQAEFAEQQVRADADAVRARVDALVTAGKLAPADKARVAGIALQLAPTQVLEFQEGDTKTQVQAREVLFDLLTKPTASPEFGERRMDPDAPEGSPAEPDAAKRVARIQALVKDAAAKGQTLSFAEAARQVWTATT